MKHGYKEDKRIILNFGAELENYFFKKRTELETGKDELQKYCRILCKFKKGDSNAEAQLFVTQFISKLLRIIEYGDFINESFMFGIFRYVPRYIPVRKYGWSFASICVTTDLQNLSRLTYVLKEEKQYAQIEGCLRCARSAITHGLLIMEGTSYLNINTNIFYN